MPAGLADLLHDAAILHRFADFIEEYCREQKRSQRYVDASGDFFSYAERLAQGIKDYLCGEVGRANRLPPEIAVSRIAAIRRNVLTLKTYLRLLHTLIKPAADAHTLSIPAPLIKLASDQLRQVQGMNGSNVVILLTPQLMYFQRPHTHVKEQAQQVEIFIPQASFPKKLGFIELPYSQGPSFFTNIAIYHEMGHFVYEELSTSSRPNPSLTTLHNAMSRSVTKAFRHPPDEKIRAVADRIVESWTQEIFCDLFAIRLIGPAFSFALVEILGMLGFLSPKARVKFDQEHPASACRVKEHVSLLREDSWWGTIADIESEQKRLLESLASVPRSEYTFYADEEKPGRKGLMNAFLDSIIPAIRTLVCEITKEPTQAVSRFVKSRSRIEDCLSAGVVPHEKNSSNPDPVAIINSAFCFYLTSLPELVKEYEKPEDQDNVEKHSLYTGLLEKWTMKAIEDSQIQKGMHDGPR
jgi:hypothetical protein